jgi:putative membrane protein
MSRDGWGRAVSPCQGGGRGFESRRPLQVRGGFQIQVAKSVEWHALGSRHLESGGRAMSERSPEVQFQLANERTYLAWLRTALALVASGVAAARLLAGQTLHWAWETVGVLLIMAGVVTAAMARRRWRATDAAIREGEPLPAPGIAVMVAGVIVLCGLITTALLLGTNPGRVP